MACVAMVFVRRAAGGLTAGPAPERVPTWREVLQSCVDVASFRATLARQDVGVRESRSVNSRISFQLAAVEVPGWVVGPTALGRGPARSSACELAACAIRLVGSTPESSTGSHIDQLRLVFVDRGGDGSKGTVVFWQRPKVLGEDGPDWWVHAPMPRDFVDRLQEAVTKAQVRTMEAFRCVQSATTHQHTYLPTWLLFFPVCVVGAVTVSPIGWHHLTFTLKFSCFGVPWCL